MNQLNLEKRQQMMDAFHKRVASSSMIIENSTGQVLIVKASYKSHWTFPGGIIDIGESPIEAACRETHEEVGLRYDAHDVTFVSIAHRRSDIADSYQFVFKATAGFDNQQLVVLQASEIDEYAFVSSDEVRTGNRNYGAVITDWADGVTGYLEQLLTN